MVYFNKAIKKLQKNGNKKIIGGLSAVCAFFIVNLLGLIFGDTKGWIILMSVLGALFLFCKLQKCTKEIFDGWCEDLPFFFHIGLIVGTFMVAKPLIIKYYEKPDNGRNTN